MAFPLVLAFKLVATPLLIGGLSLAARRYGNAVGGWLVGLPLTSGPVSVFLALEQGRAFAAEAATGMIAGIIAVAAFALAYTRIARRHGWVAALGGGFLAFGLVDVALARLEWGLTSSAAGALIAVVFAYRWLPHAPTMPVKQAAPWWDIPGRMAVATAIVLVLTALADSLGPARTGLLSPFPVFTAVLGAFTHRHAGAAAAMTLVRGLMLGLTGFVAFFLVIGYWLPTHDLLPTYATAAAVGLVVHGSVWAWLRPRAVPVPEP